MRVTIRLGHVRKTLSAILLGKAAISGGFIMLTLCGVTLPYFGVDLTTTGEASAAVSGGLLGGALAVLRA